MNKQQKIDKETFKQIFKQIFKDYFEDFQAQYPRYRAEYMSIRCCVVLRNLVGMLNIIV